MEEAIVKNTKKKLAILIIVCILIFLIGIGLGFALKPQNKAEVAKNKAVNNLSSKVITSVAAYGQVTKIQGKEITLSNLGDSLSVSVADSAQVFSFQVPAGSSTPVQKIVSFSDIKIGDSVNVSVKLLPTGQMQGTSVIILPQANQGK